MAPSAAWIERLSIISIAAGTMPAETIPDTTSPAWVGESKKATSVRTASGAGMTRRMALVATPSVPSEPTKAPVTSSPAGSSSWPPSHIISPSGSTTSRPVT